MEYNWGKGSETGNPGYNFPYIVFDDVRRLIEASSSEATGRSAAEYSILFRTKGSPDISLLGLVKFLDLIPVNNLKALPEGELLIGPVIPNEAVINDEDVRAKWQAVKKKFPNGSVAMAVIDSGIAFANDQFRNLDDCGNATKSRFEYLWMMDRAVPSGSWPFPNQPYGTVLDKSAINKLLEKYWDKDLQQVDERALYAGFHTNFPLPPERDELSFSYPHGTQVLDILTGYPSKKNVGNRPILGVQLPSRIVADTSGALAAILLPVSTLQILEASRGFIDQNGKILPLIINISMAITAGPKNGQHIIESELDQLIRQEIATYNRRVELIFPVGNHRQDQLSAKMKLGGTTGQSIEQHSIDLEVMQADRTASFVEIWLPENVEVSDKSVVSIALKPPDSGDILYLNYRAKNGYMYDLKEKSAGNTVASVFYIAHQTALGHGQQRIVLGIYPTEKMTDDQPLAPSGKWKIVLMTKEKEKFVAEVSVQRDETIPGFRSRGKQAFFVNENYARYGSYGEKPYNDIASAKITRKGTISALATGEKSTAVTGTRLAPNIILQLRYAGDTMPGQTLPEETLCDDGGFHQGIIAAGRLSGTTRPLVGTSAAAPKYGRDLADRLETKDTAQLPVNNFIRSKRSVS